MVPATNNSKASAAVSKIVSLAWPPTMRSKVAVNSDPPPNFAIASASLLPV